MMPIFRMRCERCGHEQEWLDCRGLLAEVDNEEPPKCPNCQVEMVKSGTNASFPLLWPKEGLVLEHVEETPRRFMTKRELKEYCKEKGYSSGALL